MNMLFIQIIPQTKVRNMKLCFIYYEPSISIDLFYNNIAKLYIRRYRINYLFSKQGNSSDYLKAPKLYL